MTDMDQIADEAIDLRTKAIRRAVAGMARILAVDFRADHPALDDLAVARLTALAELAERGITPDPGCSATSGATVLRADPDDPPLQHRWRIMQGDDEIGVGWLATSPATTVPGRCVLRAGNELVVDATLYDALRRLARLLDHRAQAGGR